jgi:hypothetical protein
MDGKGKEMKKLILTLLLVFSAATLMSGYSYQVEQYKRVQYIYPGKGVAEFVLGDVFQRVNSTFKVESDIVNRVSGESGAEELWFSYDSIGFTLIYDYETQILNRIIVKNKSFFVVDTRLSIGSDAVEIKRYFDEIPETRRPLAVTKGTETKSNFLIWDFPNKGIEFWIDVEQMRIVSIAVYLVPKE